MQQFLIDYPDIFAQLLGLVMALVTLAIGWAARRVGQRAGIQIEQTHIDRINAAVRHVTAEALADGKTDLGEISRIAGLYLRMHLPDAVAAVQPSPAAIHTIAAAHKAAITTGPPVGIVPDPLHSRK
jgi:hypothetical protein